MVNRLTALTYFLLFILTVLLVICLGKSWLFYVANHTRHIPPLAHDSTLVFNVGEKEIARVQNSFATPFTSGDFLPTIYSVNYYHCYLAVQTDHNTLFYWWFLEPFANRVVLLPAPALWGRPLSPALVYPDLLTWQREKNPLLYRSLKQTLGTDQNVHNTAETCKVRPSTYVF